MFDCHVHAAPDVLDRIGDDTDIALAYAADGYDGFVLKGHYESTVGRAQAAARLTGLAIYGGIALNQHCGGVNPSAVALPVARGCPSRRPPTHRSGTIPALGGRLP